MIRFRRLRKNFETLPNNMNEFKKIVTECKKTTRCNYCQKKVGKIKKVHGFATKISFTPPKYLINSIRETKEIEGSKTKNELNLQVGDYLKNSEVKIIS